VVYSANSNNAALQNINSYNNVYGGSKPTLSEHTGLKFYSNSGVVNSASNVNSANNGSSRSGGYYQPQEVAASRPTSSMPPERPQLQPQPMRYNGGKEPSSTYHNNNNGTYPPRPSSYSQSYDAISNGAANNTGSSAAPPATTNTAVYTLSNGNLVSTSTSNISGNGSSGTARRFSLYEDDPYKSYRDAQNSVKRRSSRIGNETNVEELNDIFQKIYNRNRVVTSGQSSNEAQQQNF
jgi:hypothetical protein